MAGESFQQLLELGQPNKRRSIESVSLNKDIADAQAIQEHQAVVRRQRENEAAINQKVEASLAKKQELKMKYGTSDPQKAAAIEASGIFKGDLGKRMQIDPEGTRAAFEEAIMLTDKGGGVQDFPGDTPERDYYRQNEKGTLEFTNRPDVAAQAGFRRYNSDSRKHKDLGAPGGEFGSMSGDGGGPSGKVEDILFQGKLDQAKQIIEKPERDEKKAINAQKYFDELWDKHKDIHDITEQLKEDWFSGAAKARGLTPDIMKTLEIAARKRGVKRIEPGMDRDYYKPFVSRVTKDGEPANVGEPASVLNPGGGTEQTTVVKQNEAMAANEAAAGIEATMPTERKTTYDYARGKVKRQGGTAKVARGGKGKGVMEDISGFLEGEGRAGYGESGPVGVAKDLAAFYGPRLPGDIMSAIGGLGTGKLVAKGAKAATGIRAIENMLGKF